MKDRQAAPNGLLDVLVRLQNSTREKQLKKGVGEQSEKERFGMQTLAVQWRCNMAWIDKPGSGKVGAKPQLAIGQPALQAGQP